jgi:arylsulfatase A-like enzyme
VSRRGKKQIIRNSDIYIGMPCHAQAKKGHGERRARSQPDIEAGGECAKVITKSEKEARAMRTLTRREWLASATVPFLLAPEQKPNILFIISDDHHYQGYGAAGNPCIQTPNLDRLAGRGVQFTNGVISTPQCAPSRGLLLTGLECYQNGILSNGRIAFKEGIGPTAIEQIRRTGYETTLVGKWHIQPKPGTCGFSQAPLWLPAAASTYRDPTLRRSLSGTEEKVPGHMTDLLTDSAIDYLKNVKQPFLLWLAYTAPHMPWSEDPKYTTLYEGRGDQLMAPGHPKGGGKFDWATYYAVITHLDEAVGRLIGAVEKAGLWDNTLIVFLGDNGYLCGTKGLQGKVEAWEESIRVPYFASGGVLRARGKVDAPVASIDLPATFLDYAGVKPVSRLSGLSLRPELQTGRSKREAAFSVWNDGRPDALLVPRSVEPYRVVRTQTHKLILWESKRQSLFDLRADPGEETNLADAPAQAKLLNEMRERLEARMRETKDPALSWLA